MNCIVTAGPAHEPLDDVRRLSGTTELEFARSEIDGQRGGLTVCHSGGIENPADAAQNPPTGFNSQCDPRGNQMKIEDQYLKFVRWNEEDSLYVGYCPDLFPWGGICHGKTEEVAYHQLCDLVGEEVNELHNAGKELPSPGTRPMREAVPA